MSIAKNVELTCSSTESFEKAIRDGMKRVTKTLENVQSAWVKEQKVLVSDEEIAEYRVTLIVTFVLND